MDVRRSKIVDALAFATCFEYAEQSFVALFRADTDLIVSVYRRNLPHI
jgi:hypothetical protein